MKLEECAKILGAAYLCYPHLTLTPNTIRAWHLNFSNEDPIAFQVAVSAAAREPGREFFPTPGVVQGYMDRARFSGRPTAEDAWQKVREAGRAGRLFVGDESIDRVVRQLGGLGRISMANTEKDMPFIERDFRRLFNEFRELDSAQERMGISSAAIAGFIGGAP